MVKISDLYWRKGSLGISIYMYVFPAEHNPPHFHVYDGDDEAEVALTDCQILKGALRSATYKEVYSWWEKNKTALEDNWDLCRKQLRPKAVEGRVD